MKLHALLDHIARAGEHAANGAREEYLASIEKLHEPHDKLPGAPPRATLTPLSTLFPSALKLRHRLALTVDKNGDIDAELSYDPEPRTGWWRRPKRASIADLEIEWAAHETPEAVCRIRDVSDDKLEHHLRREKWVELSKAKSEEVQDT